MKIRSRLIYFKKIICIVVYYSFAQFLPNSYSVIKPLGKVSNWLRVLLCRNIFKKCGHIRTINRRVFFESGLHIEMGDESGIGANTRIPSNTIIGNNVMLSRDCFILSRNHKFDRIDIPINDQGFDEKRQTIIEDDCWIGMRTLLTPGRHIKKGTIVGMGSCLTKDFPEYSIVGGAPAKFIRTRKPDE